MRVEIFTYRDAERLENALNKFLKLHEGENMPSICPIVVDKRCHNKDDDALFCLVRDEEECRKCRRDFWLAEISEGKACE